MAGASSCCPPAKVLRKYEHRSGAADCGVTGKCWHQQAPRD